MPEERPEHATEDGSGETWGNRMLRNLGIVAVAAEDCPIAQQWLASTSAPEVPDLRYGHDGSDRRSDAVFCARSDA